MERAEAEADAKHLAELLEAVSVSQDADSTAEERESESEVTPAQTADSSAAEAHEGKDEGEVPPTPPPTPASGAADDAAAATPTGASLGLCSLVSPSLGPAQSPVRRLRRCASALSSARRWKRTLGHQTIPSAPRATSEWWRASRSRG